jgi:hypothetical protein
MSTIFQALAAPFDPARVSWRVGQLTKDKSKAKALAYLDARDVMQRLDAVCKPENWQNRYTHVGSITVCEIAIRVDGEWLWKSNGAGQTDIEAEKGALSDAFKRAAVLWGVGQYLYDVDAPWVRCNEYKQIEKDELPRLAALLPRPDGGKPKSAYQARKDGDYKKLAEEMKQCRDFEDLDVFLDANAQMIADMPQKWQANWTEAVSAKRNSFQRAAA